MLRNRLIPVIIITLIFTLPAEAQKQRKTTVEIKGGQFYINGSLTYKNRFRNGNKIEGLLMNSRMVGGIFDDLNPEKRNNWIYPDTEIWDPERNNSERKKGFFNLLKEITGK